MTSEAQHPNFFIVGAPKSGTTAMAYYLNQRPDVFVTNPKEPFYWCQDFERSKSRHNMHSLDAYLALYDSVDPAVHQAIGEGSTTYLQSKVAIEKIMAFNPDAKVIAMLRNPIEVVYAMWGEHRRHFLEDEDNFERAWALQADRAEGRNCSANRRMDHQAQYLDLGSYSAQLERLFEHVPESQREVIVFDDFAADTRAAYGRCVSLLGLEDDGRTEFPRVHAAKVHRSKLIGRLYTDPPAALRWPINRFKKWFAGSDSKLKHALSGAVSKKQPRQKLRPEFVEVLKDAFRDDVARTGQLLGRDLSHWTAPDESVRSDAASTGTAADVPVTGAT